MNFSGPKALRYLVGTRPSSPLDSILIALITLLTDLVVAYLSQAAYDKFLRYKERVPVCGAIILNSDATKVLLVKGFKSGASWSFPRGKINEKEQPRDCAIREVLEETGFDITPHMNLSNNWGSDSRTSAIQKGRPSNPTPSGPNSYTNAGRTQRHCMLQSEGDDHFIEIMIREQKLRMYLVTGIPDETIFETQTRQEISVRL